MKERKNNLMSLEQFKDKHYSKPGTKKRQELEEGYEEFKLGAMLLEARIEKD